MDLPASSTWRDIAPGWIKKSLGMTFLISLPALSWFIAVVFTTAMDVTTLYATSSFYAYFFSMMLLKQPLSRITVASICLAFGGVLVIVLAGASNKDDGNEETGARNRILGDIVMTGGEYAEVKGADSAQGLSFSVYTRSSTSWHSLRVTVESRPTVLLPRHRTTTPSYPCMLSMRKSLNYRLLSHQTPPIRAMADPN